MSFRIWTLFLIVAVILLPMGSIGSTDATGSFVELPFRSAANGAVLVEGSISASASGTFEVDTGANMSYLSESAVRRWRLTPRPALKSDGTPIRLADGSAARKVTVPELRLGGLVLKDIDFGVLKLRGVEPYNGDLIDGVIGVYTLQQSALLVDFAKHRLMLRERGALSLLDRARVGMLDAVELPLQDPGNDLSYHLPVTFNGEASELLLVDTGADNTEISRGMAKRLRLKADAEGHDTFGVFGKYRVNSAQVTELALGVISVKDLQVNFPQRESEPLAAPVLGLDVLTRFRVLIDFEAEKVFLLRSRKEPS